MLSDENPYQERFNELLKEVREQITALNDEIKSLEKENGNLRSKIEEIQDGQTDIYSAISESERLAMRHQVLGLISKIDDHLEDDS